MEAADEEAEIVPGVSEQQQQEEEGRSPEPQEDREERETISPATSEEDEVMVKIEEVLRLLEQLRARTSQLLGASGLHRIMGEMERRCLAFMEMELSFIVAFLMTLSPQHIDSETVRWLEQLRTLDFIHRVLTEADPRHHTLLQRAAHCFRMSNSYPDLLVMVALYCLNKHPRLYRNLLLSSSDPGLQRQVANPHGHPLIAIDHLAKKLIRWLIPREETDMSLGVMSIVGPAGMGKTTLAMVLHNRLRCQIRGSSYFQCSVMVQTYRRIDRNNELLLQDILSQITDTTAPAYSSDQSQPKTMELLVRCVSEHLRDKRYFILIDDIREALDWEQIKGAFPNNNLNSRILITTRLRSIAWSCCSDSDGLVHEMKPLNQMDSERLLLDRAFGSVDGCLPHNVAPLVDKILMRCEGIPLFLISMADWLKEQLQQQHQQEEQEERITIHSKKHGPQLPVPCKQAVSSTFEDLPNELRLLSLYMSMFPYGYKFDKDRLIMRWFYENLPWNTEERHFAQLVDRHVINWVTTNWKRNPDASEDWQWHVSHFMMHYLASKSAEMGFVFTTATLILAAAQPTEHDKKTNVPRRLALHHPDPLLPSLLQTIDLSQTRSLAISGAVNGIPLDKFVNLVVLDLEGWENLKDEDLLQVCRSKMLFLKYLSVRNTQVSKLPHDIKKLTNLNYLDLQGTRIRQLPKQIVGLQYSLGALLLGVEGITSSTETTRVPQDIRHFRNLHTLATIDLSEHPASFVKALGALHDLRVLAITWSCHQCTDGDYQSALLASISKWQWLKSLTIHCGLGCSMEFLGSLSYQPKELEKFKVEAGRFASVPQWISGLESLSFIQITVCRLGTEDLKILRDLPQLHCLILGLEFVPREAIVIESEGFTMLQRFSVDCALPWLAFRTGAMPNLTCLQLKFCSGPSNQTSVPSGIINLAKLKVVVLSYNKLCDNSSSIKMTVEVVNKEVAMHRNPIDLDINDTIVDVQEVDEATERATKVQVDIEVETKDDIQAASEETRKVVKIYGETETADHTETGT